MSASAGDRLADRRHAIRARRLRRRIRRVALLTLTALVAGGLYWAAYSPLLAVRSIEIAGASRASAAELAAATGVVTGMPIWQVRTGRVADRVGVHPWVADARVRVLFPHGVEVTVLEHEPAAWLRGAGNWLLVAGDGSVIETAAAAPDDGLPRLQLGEVTARPGETAGSLRVLGALEFIAALPDDLAAETTVVVLGEEMWADVGGHRARLGSSGAMAEKGAVLAALIATGPDPDAIIDVIAPSRPALVPVAEAPAADGEAEDEGAGGAGAEVSVEGEGESG